MGQAILFGVAASSALVIGGVAGAYLRPPKVVADTLMSEAFEHGQPYNAFATAAGFFLSFVLAT